MEALNEDVNYIQFCKIMKEQINKEVINKILKNEKITEYDIERVKLWNTLENIPKTIIEKTKLENEKLKREKKSKNPY